jgi:DNA-binding NarL/FixJ family response regulator
MCGSTFNQARTQTTGERATALVLCALLEIELKCIVLLDAGKSPESIAEYLFLSRNTVANYLKRYQAGGLEDLGSLMTTKGANID